MIYLFCDRLLAKAHRATGAGREKSKPRPSPSPFPTNRPNSSVAPSTTIESLRNSSTRCELLASRCSSTPSKDPHVEKEEYHPKCALTSRHSGQPSICKKLYVKPRG